MHKRVQSVRLLVVLSALAQFAGFALGDIVDEWNNEALNAIKALPPGPPSISRKLAMMHIAMYDANNATTGARRSYMPIPQGVPVGASGQAAAAQAAHDVLVSLFPERAAIFNERLASQLSLMPANQARADGLSVGATCGAACFNLRATDGATAPSSWTQRNLPTSWRPTGASPVPLFNQYAHVTPWTMSTRSQFRQSAPPLPGSPEFQAAYDEVKAIGSATSAIRTVDQTNIAKFWAGGNGTVTPPGQWNLIAQTVSAAQGTGFDDKLRLFALLNMAEADAAVVAWDMKYTYDYFRPITAIRQMEDPTWTPLLGTPQFQAYSSGHSIFSASGAAVLADFYSDNIAFDLTLTDASLGIFDMTRSYTSFTQAAAEAGQSRMYGGIHWQFDNTASLQAGALLGNHISDNFLAVPTPGAALVLAFGGIIVSRRRRSA